MIRCHCVNITKYYLKNTKLFNETKSINQYLLYNGKPREGREKCNGSKYERKTCFKRKRCRKISPGRKKSGRYKSAVPRKNRCCSTESSEITKNCSAMHQVDLPKSLSFKRITEHETDAYKDFCCGNSSMESFLKQEAYHEHLKRTASTTLVFLENECIGYFTLYRRPIEFNIENGKNDSRDCLDIARLAICNPSQNQGIGTLILHFIVELAYMFNERYISLDALYEKREWYKKRGFKPAILDEYERENQESLVYMYMDIFDEKLLDDYFENP